MTTQATETQDQIDADTTGPDHDDNDTAWRLIVNGVESGTISDHEMILAHTAALVDKYNYKVQAGDVAGVIYRIFSTSLGLIPYMAIMVAMITMIFAPDLFSSIVSSIMDESSDEISNDAVLAFQVGASLALAAVSLTFALNPALVIGSAVDRVADHHFFIIRSVIGETATGGMYLRRGDEVYPPRYNLFRDVVKADWMNFIYISIFAIVSSELLYLLFWYVGILEPAAVVSATLIGLRTSVMVARWYQRHWSFFKHGDTMLDALDDEIGDQEAKQDDEI